MRAAHKARIERLEAVQGQAVAFVLQVSETPAEAARFAAELDRLPEQYRPRQALHIHTWPRSQEPVSAS